MDDSMIKLNEFLRKSPSVVYPDEVLEFVDPISVRMDDVIDENLKLRKLVEKCVKYCKMRPIAPSEQLKKWELFQEIILECEDLNIEVEI